MPAMDSGDVLGRTLEELDGERWGEPDQEATGLIRDCHRLRTIPVGELSIGELRLLLGQQIGIDWLVPLALERLQDDPLAGEWYPGDVLNSVLQVGADYWDAHPSETMSLWAVRESLEQLRSNATEFLERNDWPAIG
jgi:hypothetical protein